MNKTAVFAVLIGLAGCAGSIFASIELKKMATTVSALDERLAGLERNAPATAATGDAAKVGAADSKAPATMAEVASEITRIKKDLADVKSVQETAMANPSHVAGTNPGKPAVAGTGTGTDDVRKAVDEALAAKDKAEKEADAKRNEEWMSRRTQDYVNTLATELGLTEQQKTQVTEIVAKQNALMRDLWQNRKEGEDTRAKTDELRKETDTQIKALLSSEQQTKYDEVSKNQRGRGGRGPGGGGRGGPGGGGNNGGD